MAAKLCLKDTPEVRDLTRARIPLYDINKVIPPSHGRT
jgi:hypothetical protein